MKTFKAYWRKNNEQFYKLIKANSLPEAKKIASSLNLNPNGKVSVTKF